MGPHRTFACVVAGMGWGGIALLLGARAFGAAILPGVAAAPIIGLLVGRWFNRRFAGSSFGHRAWLSLASLYVGAAMFGLVVGAGEWIRRGPNRSLEMIWQGVVAAGYGTTLFLVALWPMAYVTHLAIATDHEWWKRPG